MSGDPRDLHEIARRQRQMCIRDSARPLGAQTGIQMLAIGIGLEGGHPVQRVTGQFGRAERPALRRKLERRGGIELEIARLVIAFQPVSYTHLRAHETVLDLVCRLLLEKKKNK